MYLFPSCKSSLMRSFKDLAPFFNWVVCFLVERVFFFIFILYWSIDDFYNVVLVSDVQQSDSVTHMHMSILFSASFPFRLL